MIDLEEAQKLYEQAQAKAAGSNVELRAAISLLGILIDEHRDLQARLDAFAEMANYGIPGGRRS